MESLKSSLMNDAETVARRESLARQLLSTSLGKVLVTGGSGGLANQILILLASRTVCVELHSLDLRLSLTQVKGVHYHTADLTNEEDISRLLGDVRPDVIIHAQAQDTMR